MADDFWNGLSRSELENTATEMFNILKELRPALGAHIQADAYRGTFPDNEEDGKYLRKQETWWRLTARAWLSDFETNKCAEEAKAKASVSGTKR